MEEDLEGLLQVVARVTGRMCAAHPADADDLRQEAIIAVLARRDIPPPLVARSAAVDYLRRVYGRPGSRRIDVARVAAVDQHEGAAPLTVDAAELIDPVVAWGLEGRLAFVAWALLAGVPKWRIAEACGVTPGQVSHYCAALRDCA